MSDPLVASPRRLSFVPSINNVAELNTGRAVPPGWTIHIHPQGWIYFSNPKQRLVTDEDIRIPEVYHNVEEYLSTYSLENIDENMEIVIPPGAEPGEHALTLVLNHLHSTASYILDEVKTENFHKLEHRIRTRRHKAYWNFLQWHPSHRPTPPLAAVQVRDALTWYLTDNLVSGLRSTVPFSKAECEDLLRILDTSQGPGSSESTNAARTNFVSWILREIWNFRDAEEFGQHTFRQSSALRQQRADKGAAPPPSPPPVFIQSLLNLTINVLFFAIPWTYHAHVKDASEYRGRLSNMQKRWEDYIRRLVQEYQDFLLIATVLLSATVSFLAIPNLDAISTASGIVSVFASLGSIIIGVFCVWQHQANVHQSNSFAYLHNAKNGAFGVTGHALLLSLPPVLLVWSIIAFAVAFIAYTIQGLTSSSSDLNSSPCSDSDADSGSCSNGTGLDKGAAWAALGVSLLVIGLVVAAIYTIAVIWKWRSRWRWSWARRWGDLGKSGRGGVEGGLGKERKWTSVR